MVYQQTAEWKAMARQMRAKYPHSTILSRTVSPRPDKVDADEDYDFEYLPLEHGEREWRFLSLDDLTKFVVQYG